MDKMDSDDKPCGICGRPAIYRMEIGTETRAGDVRDKEIFLCARHAGMFFEKIIAILQERTREKKKDQGGVRTWMKRMKKKWATIWS